MNDYTDEFKEIVRAYERIGGNRNDILSKDIGSLVINADRVLEKNDVEGLHIKYRKIKNGVSVKVYVDKNSVINYPVHLCFGMLPSQGTQIIKSDFFIGDNSRVKFISHCFFPNAKRIEHIMKSLVRVGKNAEMSYLEEHYHSNSGGTFVYPKVIAHIDSGGKLLEEFKLIRGRVGNLDIDYEVSQDSKSSSELLAKVCGKKTDSIKIREAIYLNGPYASGIAKSRIVLTGSSHGNVLGEVEGNAPHTRGHVDCHEIVHGRNAVASSTPRISVNDPLARVTHEAAIGRINKKELETLMARGLTENEAIDFIIKGLLR